MPQARALSTIFHNGTLLRAGDVFEYTGELLGKPEEGMEWVTKKSTAAFAKVEAEAQKALEDTAKALRAGYEAIKHELEADPSRGDLVQKALDAEQAAIDAEKAAADNAAQSDLV